MNKKGISLVVPKLSHITEVKNYVNETLEIENKVSGDGGVSKFTNYEEWLSFENNMHQKKTTPKHLVHGQTFFLMDNQEIIGMINIRYELNDNLLEVGGHIGYSIRPKYRKLGYGKMQLQLALEKCREIGLDKVLLTCKNTNLGSKRIIISCGGILENEIVVRENVVERYWIKLNNGIQV